MGYENGKRRFNRNYKTQNYRPTFTLCCEGEKTEIEYFNLIAQFFRQTAIIRAYHPKKANNPSQVLNYLKIRITESPLKYGDEAWVVIDQDDWCERELEPLTQWLTESKRHGVAMSIPQFEIWLLLHFCDELKQLNKDECLKNLKHFLPQYNKSIPKGKIASLEQVKKAIERDKMRTRMHRASGSTPLYASIGVLMERILLHHKD